MVENGIFLFSALQQNVEKEELITKYGCREDNSSRRCLFESKILRNSTNTIAAIIFQIAHLSGSQSLSLQRCQEKKIG
jgi:hypothetical protein